LVVGGTATVASGAKIDVDVKSAGANLHVGDVLLGVISAGTLSGGTSMVVTDNSALLNFRAVIDSGNANWIDLNVLPGLTVVQSTIDHSNTPAIAGAAPVLDAIIAAPPLAFISVVKTFQDQSTSQELSQAASQTLPLFIGSTDQAVSGALSDINRVVQARIESNLGLSAGDGFAGDKHAWLKPFGSWADQHDDKGVPGYKANTGGFAIGGDAALSDGYRFGMAFAYASSHIDGKSSVAPQSATVDLYHLIAYGSYNLAPDTELNYQFDIGNDRVEGTRHLPTFGVTAKSTYDATVVHGGVGIGRSYKLSEANTFTPSARIDYTSIRDKSYSESGADALNLNVASHSTEQLLVSVDAKFTHKISDSTTLLANLGGAYDANAKQASITAAFAGDPGVSFVTQGLEPEAWTTRGGLGVASKTAGGTEFTARYDAECRRGFTNQTVSVKARWAF
jgi:outer membrane autotransporter protein